MRLTEVSGLESSSFRFDPVTEDLKERMAEKSWTSIEVSSIALEPRDRLPGSVVHVHDVMDYLCKHGREGDLVNNGHRDRCILCEGAESTAESFDGYGDKSEHFRMAAADLLELIDDTPLQSPVDDLREFVFPRYSAEG